MQTFSKAYGMAAARVGMAFATPAIIKYFNRIKPPYNISTINQKAILKKLAKREIVESQVKRLKSERNFLLSEIKKLDIAEEVFHSDANFILVRVKDARYVYNYLVERGIIVRNRSSAVNNCIRITVGKKNENRRLIESLKSIRL